MVRACTTKERTGMHIGIFWKSHKERGNYEDLDISARVIIHISNWILEKQDEVVWIGFIWLRIGTGRVLTVNMVMKVT
jgi:hypothetical protein